MMIDTLDGKFDFSRFLIDMNGFIPVPGLVTEPALGSFGGFLAPVFIHQKDAEPSPGYVPPDITAGMGMLTANGSWGLGAFRMGSFPKAGIKYQGGIFYGSINLDFYRELPNIGERSFTFNIRSTAIFASISKKVFKEKEGYLGIQYSFAPTNVEPRFEAELPDFVEPIDLDNTSAALTFFADWDTRNTIFTPDSGLRTRFKYGMNDSWIGSDFTFQRFDVLINWFVPLKDNWVSGLRLETKSAFGDPPFYLLPGIEIRGVPAARYQGKNSVVLETEQRYDLNLRWSIVGFAGWAKAIPDDQTFSESDNIFSVGTGFRYLIARVFRLRAGLDIAFSPDNFGYYIVFGHNWNR